MEHRAAAPDRALAAIFPPVTAFNLGCLLLNALNGVVAGWAGAVLAEQVFPASIARAPRLAPLAAALAASLLLAAAPYPWHEFANGRSEQGLLAPVIAYLALAPGALGGARPALPAALSLALCGAVYWFDAIFLGLFTACCLPLFADRRAALGNAARIAGLAALLALPFAAPVLWAALTRGQVYIDLKDHVKPDVLRQHAAIALPAGLCWPLLPSPGATKVVSLASFPLLAWAWRYAGTPGRWLGACCALAIVLGAGSYLDPRLAQELGGNVPLPTLPMAWLGKLPIFSRFWWPYRLLGIVVPAVALAGGVLAAAAAARFAHRRLAGAGIVAMSAGLPLALGLLEGRALLHPSAGEQGIDLLPAQVSRPGISSAPRRTRRRCCTCRSRRPRPRPASAAWSRRRSTGSR